MQQKQAAMGTEGIPVDVTSLAEKLQHTTKRFLLDLCSGLNRDMAPNMSMEELQKMAVWVRAGWRSGAAKGGLRGCDLGVWASKVCGCRCRVLGKLLSTDWPWKAWGQKLYFTAMYRSQAMSRELLSPDTWQGEGVSRHGLACPCPPPLLVSWPSARGLATRPVHFASR